MSSNLDRYLDLYNSIGYDIKEIESTIEEIEDRYNDKEVVFQCLMRLANERNEKEREAATYLWVVLDKNRKGLERIFWQIESLVPEKGLIGSTESMNNISSNN